MKESILNSSPSLQSLVFIDELLIILARGQTKETFYQLFMVGSVVLEALILAGGLATWLRPLSLA